MKLDEAFDLVVSRPLAKAVAPRFHRAGFSADQVSLLALVCGVGAGLGLATGGMWAILGGLLLVAMVVIDCADGEVARLYPPSDKPWRGRIMDGIADLGTVLSVHVGMYIVLTRDGLSVGSHALSNLEIALLVVLGFMSFSWKSSVLDDIKQRLRPVSVDRDLARYRHQEKTLVERFLYWLLVQYVASAERLTGDGRPGGAQAFRLVSHVGPTHHLVAIAVASVISAFVPNAFLAYLFATIIPGNLYLWAVLHRERRRALAGA
jgi:phosphatidylglycerophosphate synthase